jgi:CheY-like chemotaxis protein
MPIGVGSNMSEQTATPLRILVVDDHQDTTRFLTRLLTGSGYAATGAEGFQAGLAAAKAGRYDLLICDIGLSDGDGCDLLARVAAMYPVRAVAVTGYGMPDDLHRVERAGFDQWLLKPVAFDKLRAIVEQVAADLPVPKPPA